MYFRQYELPCLSLFSYMIGDERTGRAVVVDPQRDVSGYLADAEAHGLTIELILETHFHADFLSGHLELAEATGAAIAYGSEARADFPIRRLSDRERIELGDVVLEARHTPGHTPESISIVVYERAGDEDPWAVLTGDTLFVGDVGRPDLLTSVGWTADDLARRLYRSLHDQLLTLPDETRVFPAHGAGSACGKSMSEAVSSTIGEQRLTNYALRPMTEDEFVAAVTEGQSVAPLYFAFTADSNRRQRDLFDDREAPPRLDLADLERCRREDAVLIDGRTPEAFASGHVAGSVNVGLDGRFAEYAGDVVRPGQPIVVLTDDGRDTEARVRLARIGFDRVRGAVVDVERVLADHPEFAERAHRVSAVDLDAWRVDDPDLQIVDIRGPGELEVGLVPGAVHIPLAQLLDRHGELDTAAPVVVYCAGGYRSSIGASLLRSLGFERVADLQGGFDAWAAGGFGIDQGALAR
ncbi:MAG: rhodanese-like domain-containing protein [Acidimicrobiales bacterium]|nr:rhodanese-like domain-containing protein [Acidimicrobiales bacterium]